jgi:predicted nucleic acid-binding protein
LVILIDSNVFNRFLQIYKGTDTMTGQERDWWIGILNCEETVVNPVPRAVEGYNGLTRPTPEEVSSRLQEDSERLKEMFPKIKVVEHREEVVDAVLRIIDDSADQYNAESDFLLEVSP